MKSTLQQIRQKQRDWAKQRNIDFNASGYTDTLEANLFAPLSSQARKEFATGSGGELGTEKKRGKMQALHSSSALVCNVFDPWRDRQMAPLARAINAPDTISDLQFERTCPTELGGLPPHLDVLLFGPKAKPFAIESKFTEPYQAHQSKIPFRDSYFPEQPGLWTRCTLPRCEELARSIYERPAQYIRLGAAQLLKHILGLYKAHGNNFTLLYLWYEYPSDEADRHQLELKLFKQQLDSSLDFRSMTYAELFERLRKSPGVESQYLLYLEGRYFSA